MRRYTLSDFLKQYATDRACLERLAKLRWPEGILCHTCERVTPHHLIESRKCYSCQECSAQTYPTAGTIFHKSRTPLPIWFYVIFQMAQTRCGVAAKEIERQTGVTYKTAWRMCHLVRASLREGDATAALFSGVVEVDECYVGARRARYFGQRKPGRPTADAKQPVFGIVERGGSVRAYVVPDVKRSTVLPLIQKHAEEGATVYTDEYAIYRTLEQEGYRHDVVRHKVKQYAKEVVDEETGEVFSVHTNTIEGFWSAMKGGVLNVHRGVGRRYLQRYVDEFAFRYSHRNDDRPMFLTMLNRAAQSGKHAARLP